MLHPSPAKVAGTSAAGISAAAPEFGAFPSWCEGTENLPWLPPAEKLALGFFSALIKIITLQNPFCLPESSLKEQGMKRVIPCKWSARPGRDGAFRDGSGFSPPPADRGPGKVSSMQPCLEELLGQEARWTTVP